MRGIEKDLSKQLHASVRSSNLETSLRLIVQGADPNYFHEEKRSTPLHVAAKFGQASQIELLLVYGANTNAVDGNEFIGLKKPDHSSGKHLNVPDPSQLNISEPVKIARGKLQLIPNKIFEELVMDIYDEVDRRENEAIWSTTVLQPESGCVPV
uniref:GIT Spa2 homology (SHD) domain-containing protein n=1 Tax=Megaselia scalaris TaxID=36166 RepID=T1GK81_MEGSC